MKDIAFITISALIIGALVAVIVSAIEVSAALSDEKLTQVKELIAEKQQTGRLKREEVRLEVNSVQAFHDLVEGYNDELKNGRRFNNVKANGITKQLEARLNNR